MAKMSKNLIYFGAGVIVGVAFADKLKKMSDDAKDKAIIKVKKTITDNVYKLFWACTPDEYFEMKNVGPKTTMSYRKLAKKIELDRAILELEKLFPNYDYGHLRSVARDLCQA